MPLITGSTTNFACNSLATLSNHEVTTLELQRFRAVLNLRPVELPAELVEPIPTTTHTPSKDVVGFTKVPQSLGTSTSSFTTRHIECSERKKNRPGTARERTLTGRMKEKSPLLIEKRQI